LAAISRRCPARNALIALTDNAARDARRVEELVLAGYSHAMESIQPAHDHG
jgi:hypothetical protein